MSTMTERLRDLLRQATRDVGQGLAEYALILALIAMVAVVAVTFLGSALSSELTTIGEAVASANP